MAKSLQHKILDFEVKEVGAPEERTLEFIGSTDAVDRYGDVVDVQGWDLKNFKKNPVILFAHNYSQPPVGKAIDVQKGDKGLTFRVHYPTDEEINAAGWPANHPTPETVYRLYKSGLMKAVSVGFQGLKSEPIRGEVDESGFQPRTGTHYLKQELYELSMVPVPANPEAVMNAVQKGIITADQAKAFEASEEKAPVDEVPPEKEYGPINQRLIALGIDPIPEDAEKAIQEHLMDGLKQTLADTLGEFNLKAGAVLSAKNKDKLTKAMGHMMDAHQHCKDVMDAAAKPEENAAHEPEPKPSYYRTALDPGAEPHGARPADAIAEKEAAEVEELRTLTANLHLTVCK
jgi:HK97 family phage prohead protease